MVTVVVVLLAALVVGRLAGGSTARLADLPLRRRWLVAAAVAAQLTGALVAGTTGDATGYVVGLAVSAAAAAAFLAGNLRVPGLPLVAAGLLANAAVVAANGTMPVSLVAAARAGVPIVDLAAGTDPRHDVAGTGTVARPLGDVVPVPWPWRGEVLSPGDVLVAAGIGLLVVAGMRGRYAGTAGPVTEQDAAGTGPDPDPGGCAGMDGSTKGDPDGEEGTQAAGPREAQGEPRPQAEREPLTRP